MSEGDGTRYEGKDPANHAYYVDGYGYVAYSYGSNYVSSEFRVKPTFYLSIDTQITGGTGTKVDPYLIY